jgi:hypothetical protein
MKIELGYTMWEGCWQECALCCEGFRAHEVEAHTQFPGEVAQAPVCRRCVLGSKLWLGAALGSCATWRSVGAGVRGNNRGTVPRRPPEPGAEKSGQVRTDLWGSDES